MDPKQELFGLLEGVLKTEPEEDDLICKETFKNEHGVVIGGIANIFDSQIEQFGNVDGIKLEKIDCEVPKIESEGTSEVKAADMFININDIIKQEISETATNLISLNDESTSKKRSEFPTTIKNELENFSDNKVIDIGGDIKQEVGGFQKLKTESELLTSHCDLPTLKDESEDYPDYYNLPCSSKQAESRSNLPLPENAGKIVSKKKKLYPCPVCQKNFPSSKSRSKHIDGHFGKRFAVCQFCGQFMNRIDFLRHYFIHKVKYRFGNASQKISKVPWLQQHLVIQTNEKPINGDISFKKLNVNYLLNRDFLINHVNEKFKCDNYLKEFLEKGNYQQHLMVYNGEKPFKCDFCSKTFIQNSHLKQHLLIHTNELLFKCDICSKRFNDKSNLQDHLIIHTDNALYQCDICFKRFNHKASLVNHLIIHTDNKPFKCDVCSKTFNRYFSLGRHLKLHANETPFKCAICSKSFNDKGNLKKHLTSHTNEKTHKCDLCSKTFKFHSCLRRHLKIHNNETPIKCDNKTLFKCDICSKVSYSKYELKQHLISHSNKIFSCHICSKVFGRKYGMNRHLRDVHNDNKSH